MLKVVLAPGMAEAGVAFSIFMIFTLLAGSVELPPPQPGANARTSNTAGKAILRIILTPCAILRKMILLKIAWERKLFNIHFFAWLLPCLFGMFVLF